MNDPRIVAFQAESVKTLEHLRTEYSKLQTGRANASLVEHIDVDAYGQRQPLKNLAGITVQDARTIAVQPWDKSIMQNIDKALQTANLGSSPVNDGVLFRITLPSMNQERRVQLGKLVHQLAEDARISIRKHRQNAHDAIKQDKDEDVKETALEYLQKAVDEMNSKVADMAKAKEEEIMKV